MKRRTSRDAAKVRWSWAASRRLAEPRMAGKLRRLTTLAISSPSGDREISTRRGFFFSTRRQATASAMRPCQKQAITPSGEATAASTDARSMKRQRMVARVTPR